MHTRSFTAVLAAGLLLAACGGSSNAGASGDATTGQAPTGGGGSAVATVAVASSNLGDILVDGDGMTLYAFLPDDQGDPTCTDGCADNWPPLVGPATAGDGVDEALLGTVAHPSGVTMVAYDGWPLYHFAGDQAAGDVNGQGVGDNWYVVGADGSPIDDAAPTGAGYGY
jgi:predicted lipoprotein with Yx(FWY)xxD motif